MRGSRSCEALLHLPLPIIQFGKHNGLLNPCKKDRVGALVKQTAAIDGQAVRIYIEQEPGAGGKTLIDYYVRQLAGYSITPNRPTVDKVVRASPVSSQTEAGNVILIRGPWINDFLDEVEAFPGGSHDDQVDAMSGAFGELISPNLLALWQGAAKLMHPGEANA